MREAGWQEWQGYQLRYISMGATHKAKARQGAGLIASIILQEKNTLRPQSTAVHSGAIRSALLTERARLHRPVASAHSAASDFLPRDQGAAIHTQIVTSASATRITSSHTRIHGPSNFFRRIPQLRCLRELPDDLPQVGHILFDDPARFPRDRELGRLLIFRTRFLGGGFMPNLIGTKPNGAIELNQKVSISAVRQICCSVNPNPVGRGARLYRKPSAILRNATLTSLMFSRRLRLC